MNKRERRVLASSRLALARDDMTAAMRMAEWIAVEDAADGVPEAVIARELGVSRLTVRRWLGKNKTGGAESGDNDAAYDEER